MSENRIQKILAQAGIASRRKAEELIKDGAVTVNGKVAKLGDKATFGKDHIKLNGKLIHKVEPNVYVLFYKPKGVISLMQDPEGRPTLKNFLAQVSVRLFPVSTLDFNADGLLLLTNDGDLAEAIQKNPKFPRVYHAKLKGYLTAEMVKRIERGGKVGESGYVKPYSVRIQEELNKKTKVEIVLLGEASADLKAFLESRGFLVEKITRVGMGHLTLKGLEPGDFKLLPKSKLEALVLQPELGVKELERRVDKERSILPIDLQEDGQFKTAMTLAPKGKKKEASITALRDEVATSAMGTEERANAPKVKPVQNPNQKSNPKPNLKPNRFSREDREERTKRFGNAPKEGSRRSLARDAEVKTDRKRPSFADSGQGGADGATGNNFSAKKVSRPSFGYGPGEGDGPRPRSGDFATKGKGYGKASETRRPRGFVGGVADEGKDEASGKRPSRGFAARGGKPAAPAAERDLRADKRSGGYKGRASKAGRSSFAQVRRKTRD